MLCVVPDAEHVRSFTGHEPAQELHLAAVRVLELVHQYVVVETGDLLPCPATRIEQPECILHDALVVRLRCLPESVAIPFEHGSGPHEVRSSGPLAEVAQPSGSEQVFLGAEHQVVDLADGGGPVEGAGRQAPRGGVLFTEYVRDESPLFAPGDDPRRAAQAEGAGVAAHYGEGEGVEGAHLYLLRFG